MRPRSICFIVFFENCPAQSTRTGLLNTSLCKKVTTAYTLTSTVGGERGLVRERQRETARERERERERASEFIRTEDPTV
jgi:hypothetical protein